MVRSLITGLVILLSTVCFTTNADNKIRNKADEHFVKKEWKEASEVYNVLLHSSINDFSLYAPAIVSAGNSNNYDRVMKYISLSSKTGIPLDSIFSRTLSLSLKTRSTIVYERMLLTIKQQQPWLEKFINNHLLSFYYNRKNCIKAIEIADAIIAKNPKNIIEVMSIKAKALNDMGNINSAVSVVEDILSIDSNNIDARIFLGYYYYTSAKQSIKDFNFVVKIPTKRDKKSNNIKYINTDIYTALKRAKHYLSIDGFTDKSPYLQEVINEIITMINAFEEPITTP